MFLVGDMQMLHVYVQPAIISSVSCNLLFISLL